jgi:hypothetical protein
MKLDEWAMELELRWTTPPDHRGLGGCKNSPSYFQFQDPWRVMNRCFDVVNADLMCL